MIVFTIAFGERYIKRFFERCLPSLFAPDRPLKLGGEKISLRVITLKRDADLITRYKDSDAVRYFSSIGTVHVDAVAIESGESAELPDLENVKRTLLLHAVAMCIENDEVFVHASPDHIYAPGVIDTCFEMHRLTGKVIALFNGRVAPTSGEPDFPTEILLSASKSARGMVDFFFNNMNALWRNNSTSDPSRISGIEPGMLAFQSDDRRIVFYSNPNPFLGKFKPTDLLAFAGVYGFSSWDHGWRDALVGADRLLIQSDLNCGISIEVGTGRVPKGDGTPKAFLRLYDPSEQPEHEARREAKFAGSRSFCFTAAR